MFKLYILLGLLLLLQACQNTSEPTNQFASVFPVLETEPVASAEDAADDPAIWINTADVSASLILGTDKKAGLLVYNLQGQLVQSLPQGRLNNVDIRQGVRLAGMDADIVVASNRTTSSIDIFSVSAAGTVSLLQSQPVSLTDPYGICMSLSADGKAHVFINSKDAQYQHWILNPGLELAPELRHSFALKTQPEGCTVDDATGMLYMGEENEGIWKLSLDLLDTAESAMELIDSVASPHITADVEGMDIWRRGSQAYLVVSSQGDFSYAVYNLSDNDQYMGSFNVADNTASGIDGSEETDGLTISPVGFDERFPDGLLVVQDGYNRLPAENQNFKLVSWRDVLDLLTLAR